MPIVLKSYLPGQQVPSDFSATATAVPQSPPFSLTPGPTQGQGPYGLVPGPVGAPPSRFQQTTTAVPGLGQPATDQLTQNIMSELQGQLSPETLRNIQDASAQFGISSGMPGSGLVNNRTLRNIGLTTAGVQGKGQTDYLAALQGIGGQQLDPALLNAIAESNANKASAPDPQQAAQALMNLFRQGIGSGGTPTGGQAGFDALTKNLLNMGSSMHGALPSWYTSGGGTPALGGGSPGGGAPPNQPGYFTDPNTGQQIDIWTGEVSDPNSPAGGYGSTGGNLDWGNLGNIDWGNLGLDNSGFDTAGLGNDYTDFIDFSMGG